MFDRLEAGHHCWLDRDGSDSVFVCDEKVKGEIMRVHGRAIHLGAFVPGSFTVPQTPVVLTPPTVRRRAGVAEFVPGKFAVPQDPVSDANRAGIQMAAGAGMGCGGCGMGDLPSTWTALQSQTILTFPAGYVLAGLFGAAIILPLWMSGRKR
jgi:hypothetical protein